MKIGENTIKNIVKELTLGQENIEGNIRSPIKSITKKILIELKKNKNNGQKKILN